jgi:translation initiation factor IF-1
MPRADAIVVDGLVLEVLSDRTVRLELANGHRLLGFFAGKKRPVAGALAPGNKVRLELSPFDLSKGRIIVENETI